MKMVTFGLLVFMSWSGPLLSQGLALKESNAMLQDHREGDDAQCHRGLLSEDSKICCSARCWSCGPHSMCGNATKYREFTNQERDDCCADIIIRKGNKCDDNMAPCVVTEEVISNWRKEDLEPITEVRHKRNVDIIKQRQFRTKLFEEVKKNYDFAKDTAQSVEALAGGRVAAAEAAIVKYDGKLNGPQQGVTDIMTFSWISQKDNSKDEIRFYGMIHRNAVWVGANASGGLDRVDEMKVKIQVNIEKIDTYGAEVETLHQHSKETEAEAQALWKQWLNSAKHFNCTQYTVEHAKEVCNPSNTATRKCKVVCHDGYDSKESQNSIKCLKQGKFGKELYGELSGVATCVGRNCKLPPSISNAGTIVQDIIYPNVAGYTCFEGHSMDGSAKGNKTFTVACNTKGNFSMEPKFKCEPIRCGGAPAVKNGLVVDQISGYVFAQTVNYKCNVGHTITGLAGGVEIFAISCLGSGEFTQPLTCQPVRCGLPPTYPNIDMLTKTDRDQVYAEELKYSCKAGYTFDQQPEGPKAMTLTCHDTGDFIVKGKVGQQIPSCRPVSAGMAPKIPHGDFVQKEMFYTENQWVVAELGYSTISKAGQGLSFNMIVTKVGGYAGIQTFKPVDCGGPPAVKNGKNSFQKTTAVFKDFVDYVCTTGYSTDATKSRSKATFTIHCESDGTYSKIPGTGNCVNIDDCAEHTCGPFGACVDQLSDYTCDCLDGYEQTFDDKLGEKVCGNIDDCGPEACGVGKCEDMLNDYNCICPSGYEQVGTGEGKTCTAVTCGNPPELNFGLTQPVEAGNSKAFFPQTILYKCETGYTLNGASNGKNHFNINCQPNKYFTDSHSCKPINCGAAPMIAYAMPNKMSAVYGETVKFTCAHGHSLDATPTGDNHFSVTCQDTGMYSLPQNCLPVACGEPAQISNAQRANGKRVFEDVVEFSCSLGHSTNGQKNGPMKFTSKCKSDGKFTTYNQCQPKVCGEPPSKINVKHSTVPDLGNVRFPEVVEITCRDGYTVDGSARGNSTFNVACNDKGSFDSYDPKECDAVRCGKAPDMPNAVLSDVIHAKSNNIVQTTNLVFGLKARYTCKPGYTVGGEFGAPMRVRVECLPNGEFSVPLPNLLCRNVNDCERHTCGAHGTCVDEIGPAPAYTCKCEFGYAMTTKSNGEKICGNVDDCGDHGCGAGVCRDLVGDYTCICPTGHFLDIEKDGEKTCSPMKCEEKAPVVAKASLLTQHTGPVLFPAQLSYKCAEGYSTDASPTESAQKFQASCKPHGKLMGVLSCQPVACGTAGSFAFTKVTFPEDKRHVVTYGQSAKYECFEGYSVSGAPGGSKSFEASCQKNGVLEDPQVCEAIKCGIAPPHPKARVSISGIVTFGMTVQYECDRGHTLTGTAGGAHHYNRKCKKDGQFEASDALCKPVTAGRLPTIPEAKLVSYNGQFVSQNQDYPTAYYPKGAEYNCKDGHSLTGSLSGQVKFVTNVNSEGKLVPALPDKCQEIVFYVQGEAKDARTGIGLGDVKVTVEGRGETLSISGFFTFRGLPKGTITLKYTKTGYIPTTKTITIASNVNSGGVADLNMSPEMRPAEWRAALKWARNPSDLDTHVKWFQGGVAWNSPYVNMADIQGRLEKDDTNGFGPETAFLSNIGKCNGGAYKCDVKYMIFDYTESQTLYERSDAQVTLYNGDHVAGAWKVSDCPRAIDETRNWWHVFTIDAKTNKLKWHCKQQSMLLHVGTTANATLTDTLIEDNFENYVGPFPGRYLRKRHRAFPGVKKQLRAAVSK